MFCVIIAAKRIIQHPEKRELRQPGKDYRALTRCTRSPDWTFQRDAARHKKRKREQLRNGVTNKGRGRGKSRSGAGTGAAASSSTGVARSVNACPNCLPFVAWSWSCSATPSTGTALDSAPPPSLVLSAQFAYPRGGEIEREEEGEWETRTCTHRRINLEAATAGRDSPRPSSGKPSVRMYRCLSSDSAPVTSLQSPAQALLWLRLNSLSITRDSRFNEFVKLSTFAAVSPGDCFVFSLSLYSVLCSCFCFVLGLVSFSFLLCYFFGFLLRLFTSGGHN